MKREAPSDREIAELIAPAFERLPEPAPSRLKAVEDRLSRQLKGTGLGPVRFRYWWFIAALATAGAAAWWADEYLSRDEPPVVPLERPVEAGQPDTAPGTNEHRAEPASSEPQGRGRQIYQREAY